MVVTVLAILETDFVPDKALSRLMNGRLQQAADELRDQHLAFLADVGERNDDIIIYISYNPKYKIRFRVVNDVPAKIENQVIDVCGMLGYLHWQTGVLNVVRNLGIAGEGEK
ncbi:hypothetical protein [Pedobacter roseus]|jgi:hypothetical protein|uniref:Uncharacterized protein n=1 Tax=Pedobacter roseus TaxID=336820 RepID=A0A7G9QKA3_9SPHI|nr:hypothetical protein [Pedobacter roseus]QNN43778.1 hypothetical protein H9L23_06730 [Pedobacter roseus]